MKLETQAVIEAIRSGSEKILLLLYEKYRNEFIRWSTNTYDISNEDAKDIFQEVILVFYKNVKQDKVESGDTSLKTYLFAIGKNMILNNIRNKNVEVRVLNKYVELSHSDIDEQDEIQHMVEIVKRIYKIIGSPCKDILHMYYDRRYDMESIALRLGYKNADVAKKKKWECMKYLEDRIKLSHVNK